MKKKQLVSDKVNSILTVFAYILAAGILTVMFSAIIKHVIL